MTVKICGNSPTTTEDLKINIRNKTCEIPGQMTEMSKKVILSGNKLMRYCQFFCVHWKISFVSDALPNNKKHFDCAKFFWFYFILES